MNEKNSLIDFNIAPAEGHTYSASHFPLRIIFVNNSSGPIRLLNCFEPLPVFFSFNLVKADGTPLSLPGMGKIDFGPAPLDYITLQSGEQWETGVELSVLIKVRLHPEAYILSAIYHNQYGENCFQGKLQSNTIGIEIVSSDG